MPKSTQPTLRRWFQLLNSKSVLRIVAQKLVALLLLIGMMVPMWLAKPIMTVKAATPVGATTVSSPSHNRPGKSDKSPFIPDISKALAPLPAILASLVKPSQKKISPTKLKAMAKPVMRPMSMLTSGTSAQLA